MSDTQKTIDTVNNFALEFQAQKMQDPLLSQINFLGQLLLPGEQSDRQILHFIHNLVDRTFIKSQSVQISDHQIIFQQFFHSESHIETGIFDISSYQRVNESKIDLLLPNFVPFQSFQSPSTILEDEIMIFEILKQPNYNIIVIVVRNFHGKVYYYSQDFQIIKALKTIQQNVRCSNMIFIFPAAVPYDSLYLRQQIDETNSLCIFHEDIQNKTIIQKTQFVQSTVGQYDKMTLEHINKAKIHFFQNHKKFHHYPFCTNYLVLIDCLINKISSKFNQKSESQIIKFLEKSLKIYVKVKKGKLIKSHNFGKKYQSKYQNKKYKYLCVVCIRSSAKKRQLKKSKPTQVFQCQECLQQEGLRILLCIDCFAQFHKNQYWMTLIKKQLRMLN